MLTDIMAPVESDSTVGNTKSELETAVESMRYRAAIFAVSRQTANDVIRAVSDVPTAESPDHRAAIVDRLDADWLLFTDGVDDNYTIEPGRSPTRHRGQSPFRGWDRPSLRGT